MVRPRRYIGAWRSSFRKTNRKVSTNPYIIPQMNIITRNSKISKLVRIDLRPFIASLLMGSSRSVSILRAQRKLMRNMMSAMMKEAT